MDVLLYDWQGLVIKASRKCTCPGINIHRMYRLMPCLAFVSLQAQLCYLT